MTVIARHGDRMDECNQECWDCDKVEIINNIRYCPLTDEPLGEDYDHDKEIQAEKEFYDELHRKQIGN